MDQDKTESHYPREHVYRTPRQADMDTDYTPREHTHTHTYAHTHTHIHTHTHTHTHTHVRRSGGARERYICT
jgi:hypothetical protein